MLIKLFKINHYFLYCLFIVGLSNCTTDKRLDRLDDPNAIAEKQIKLYDSESFDYKLGFSLLRNLPSVNVTVITPFSINNIPLRIEKWISYVDKYGGKVEVKVDPKYQKDVQLRGIIGEAIDLVIAAYDAAKKAVLYDSTDDYDVIIYYNETTGMVTKFTFNYRVKLNPEEDSKNSKQDSKD